MLSSINGRYVLAEEIGRGGMGTVFRAFDTQHRRDVALKTLQLAGVPAAVEFFQREFTVLSKLSHPNIVEVFDFGWYEEGGESRPFLVMPLLHGRTLDKVIAGPPVPLDRAVEIIAQVSRGLQKAHTDGLVHRDVKPSNVWVLEDDTVKIIDFGIVHIVDTKSSLGQKGTLLYAAPEQLAGEDVTPLTDQFALAVVCYELLTRERPFRGDTEEEVRRAIVTSTPPLVPDRCPELPVLLGRVIHKAMAKRPQHRFASVQEFRETLQRAALRQPIAYFDMARVQPRFDAATKEFERGNYATASDIIASMEAEGHLDMPVLALRRQIDHAIQQREFTQILDSARAMLEAEEYPLALERLQELLQRSPNHAAGLAMRDEIERRDAERSVAGWFQSAREALERHDYDASRQLLDRILHIRPTDAQALEMRAEAERRDRVYRKTVQEKERLYLSALSALQQGNLSDAAGKLGRVVELEEQAPEATADRAATYRKLFEQVSAECQEIDRAYAEAQRCLAEGRADQALAVCKEYLTKYPNSRTFQALRIKVEERQRRDELALISDINLRIQAEPDLDEQVRIWREAADRYPFNPLFTQSLEHAQAQRSLVNDLVARARQLEADGQVAEALSQWRDVESVYPRCPDLPAQLQRLSDRATARGALETKARLGEQIDALVEAGDYAGARQLLDEAETQFPGDVQLDAARQLLEQASERGQKATQLVAAAQQRRQQGDNEGALPMLRQALRLEPRNPVARAVLIEALVAQARAFADSDMATADALLRETLVLEPGHAAAQALQKRILQAVRRVAIEQCMVRVGQLREMGDVVAARQLVDEMLSSYPGEPILLQAREQLRTATPGVPVSREAVRPPRPAPTPPAEPKPAATPRPEVAQAGAAAAGAAVGAGGARVPSSPPQGVPSEDLPTMASPVMRPAPKAGFVERVRRQASVWFRSSFRRVRALGRKAQQVPMPAWLPERHRAPALVGLVVLLALAGTAAVWSRRGDPAVAVPTATGPNLVQLNLTTAPAGARLTVDGKEVGLSPQSLRLSPAAHQVRASLDGYQELVQSLSVDHSPPPVVNLTLVPLPASLQVITNLESGKVFLDGEFKGDLQNSSYALDSVPAGTRTLSVQSGTTEAQVTFEVAEGRPPLLTSPLTAKDARAVVVTAMGARSRVHSSVGSQRLSVNGQDAGEAGPAGIDLPQLAPGPWTLDLVANRDRWSRTLETTSAPTLRLFVDADRNVGTVLVAAGLEGAQVLLNEKPLKMLTRANSPMRLNALPPGSYVIRVQKAGFLVEPRERSVTVVKGKEERLEFTLRPIPTVAELRVVGALPGTRVLLDGREGGVVAEDGSLLLRDIPPGDHVIGLRLDRHRSKDVPVRLEAGQSFALSRPDVVLPRSEVPLKVTVSPPEVAGLELSIRREGESDFRRLTGAGPWPLPEAKYTVRAQAPGWKDDLRTVTLVAGETPSMLLTMERLAVRPVAVASSGMEPWMSSWSAENDGYVPQRSGLLLYPGLQTAGTFRFRVRLSGGATARWVLHRRDAKNYTQFTLDKDKLVRAEFVNGKRVRETAAPHGIANPDVVSVRIVVEPHRIAHHLSTGRGELPVGEWQDPNQDLSEGQFGFDSPKQGLARLMGRGDKLWIAGFAFTPASR